MSQQFSNRFSRLILSVALVCSLFVTGCGCDEEVPTIVFINETARRVVVQLETSDGDEIDIGELAAGTKSTVHTIPVGVTELALTWGSIPVPYYSDFEAAYCFDYEVEFVDETVTITPIER